MRSINEETRLIMNERRNFVNYANMTLSNGTVLNLKPSDFRIAGQSFTDDWNDGDTFSIGTAIGKVATLLLDNTDGRTEIIDGQEVVYPHGKFSEYDFYMARFQLFVCLPEAYHYNGELRDEMIPIGTFTITTPTSHGSTIEITGVDDMHKFDRSFDDCDLNFEDGQTLRAILDKCCEDCLGFAYGKSFDNQDIVIYERPEDATYRQVVSWIAQIAGCNATISVTGALQLKWYDMSPFSDIDGGSFTAEDEKEKVYMQPIIWNGSGGAYKETGWIIYYNRIPRTGRYRITKVVIEDVSDISNFNGYFTVYEYDCYDGTGTNRANGIEIAHSHIIEGENTVNFEFDIAKNNYVPYWIGIGAENYMSSLAPTFKATFYIEPVSYTDSDSVEGGTFDIERKYQNTIHWNYDGSSTSTGWWWWNRTFLNSNVKPAGTYKVSKIVVSNINNPSHFNAYYVMRKSVDSGNTWTEMERGPLVNGENTINYDIEIAEGDTTRYRVSIGQEVALDPQASKFDVDIYFRADETPYLDGDDIDGGNFTSPLSYHNLTALKGTSVSTDDIQFTGVLVENEDVSAHYPANNWDYYAMHITDNPFVKDNEGVIAEFIYGRLSGLKFRIFSTSTIQDPTIEAGDLCIVYDVKGNAYYSIITNVCFKTGGMTELSCKAQAPVEQGSSYVSPSVYEAKKKTTDYASQVAHFNEIANAALGYYKTEEVDAQTGATITYLHDKATLEASTNVVKIASGIIAISDNYNTPQRSWNTGFDASTGTMLLNLLYVHGLTSDWVKTGQLTVGGVNNIDGIIHVVNEKKYGDGNWNGSGHTGGGWWSYFTVEYRWLKPAGTYTFTKIVIDNVSSPSDFIDFKYKIEVSTDSGSTWKVVQEGPLVVGDNIINYVFEIYEDNKKMYHFVVGKSVVVSTDPTFDYHPYTTSVNTVIDSDGVSIRRGNIKLGTYNDDTGHYPFEVDNTGKIYATDGEIAGLSVEWWEKGWMFNGQLSVYYDGAWHDNVPHYFDVSAYKGLNIGRAMDPSNADVTSACWSNLWWLQGYSMLRVDYGSNQDSYRGIFVTNIGNNDYTAIGSSYAYMRVDGIHVVSDRRSKTNITNLSKALCEKLILKSRPVRFKYKTGDTDEYHYGFIAQEIEEVVPDSNSVIEHDKENDIYSMNYQELIAPMIKIIQEQQKEIDELKKRLDRLEGK